MASSSGVEEAGGFVEDQGVGISEDESSQRQLLRLAWGELVANRANLGVETTRQLEDPPLCVDGVERSEEGSIVGSGAGEDQVVSDGSNEEVVLLGDESNVSSKCVEWKSRQREAAYRDRSLSGGINACKEAPDS